MIIEHNKKPKNLGIKLGKVNYGNRDEDVWEIYNKNGQAFAVKYITNRNMWLVSKKHIGMGYMLRQLGIEVNSGGQIFKHYTLPKNAFNGKNREQIIRLQSNAG